MEELYILYGFPSLSKFWEIVKNEGYKYKDVKKFIEQQKVDQVHKQVNKKNGFIVGYDGEYMADLLDMSKYNRSNSGYKWILIVVDLFTRRGYAFPLKNKTPSEVSRGFSSIIDDVKILTTDNGNEFKGPFKTMLNESNIIHLTNDIGDHKALGVIDNFSKRVKNALHKYFSYTGKVKYIDYLPIFITNYNNTPHSGILDLKPNDVMRGDNKYFIGSLNDNKKKVNSLKMNKGLNIGDNVRTKIKKNLFDKGYSAKWSGNVFKVVDVDHDKVKLNDGRELKNKNVLKVDGIEAVDTTELDKVKKETRTKRYLEREGIKPVSRELGKRKRKQTTFFF